MTLSMPVPQTRYASAGAIRSLLGRVTILDVMLASILMGPLTILSVAGRTPSLYWIDVAIVIFSGFCIAKAFAKPTDRTFHLPPAILWALAYIAVCISAMLLTDDILLTIAILKLRVMPIAVYLLARRQIRSRSDVNHFFTSLAAFGFALAAISLYNWYKFSSGALVLSEEFGEKDMLQLSFGRSNYLASMFVVLIPPLVAALQEHRKERSVLGYLAGIAIVVVALLFTQSRGSFISLTLGLMTWAFFDLTRSFAFRKIFRGVAIAVLIVVVLVIAWNRVPEDVRVGLVAAFGLLWSEASRGNLGGGRTELWVAAIQGAWQSHLFGIGLGNQAIYYANLQMTPSAHSVYLETLLETGIVGAITLTGFLFVFGRTVWLLWKNSSGADRTLAGAILASFATMLVNVSQEPSFWGPQYSCLLWMMMGMTYSWRRIQVASPTASVEAPD